jgi:hypothetical protein
VFDTDRDRRRLLAKAARTDDNVADLGEIAFGIRRKDLDASLAAEVMFSPVIDQVNRLMSAYPQANERAAAGRT